MTPGAEHLPPLNLARRFFGDDKPFERFADYIDYALEVQGDVSALIAEPLRWTTVEAPPPEFWPQVKDSCQRHGALLIFDEIPSCLGRTGTLYACEQFKTTPDILVIGKGLGGGIMPLAAILAPGGLDCAPDAALGHYTHEKSPVACAAGLATLEVIEEEKLIDRAKELGHRGLRRLGAIRERYPVIRDVRGLGCYFGVEIGGDDPAASAERLMYRCLERGLSFKIGGGNVVTLCPPLTIPFEQFDEALSIFEDALSGLEFITGTRQSPIAQLTDTTITLRTAGRYGTITGSRSISQTTVIKAMRLHALTKRASRTDIPERTPASTIAFRNFFIGRKTSEIRG